MGVEPMCQASRMGGCEGVRAATAGENRGLSTSHRLIFVSGSQQG